MILFLDFDGVLHPFNQPNGTFVLVPEFERVMRDFENVDIVISSTWREAHTLDELRSPFSPQIQQRIIDVTPIFNDPQQLYIREMEIMVWLREAGREHEPWVAIDDSEWFFSPGCRNLILLDADIGFNEKAGRELRRRLSE
jgi:hypothetical protein